LIGEDVEGRIGCRGHQLQGSTAEQTDQRNGLGIRVDVATDGTIVDARADVVGEQATKPCVALSEQRSEDRIGRDGLGPQLQERLRPRGSVSQGSQVGRQRRDKPLQTEGSRGGDVELLGLLDDRGQQALLASEMMGHDAAAVAGQPAHVGQRH
jgi:hypothetical protein